MQKIINMPLFKINFTNLIEKTYLRVKISPNYISKFNRISLNIY